MKFKLLSLGDSYTIGECVRAKDNFPNQTVQLLGERGFYFGDPEIVAKTGWTIDELLAAIDGHRFSPPYDWVTLLIGVNDQYRGRTIEDFRPQFESLLERAIEYSGNRPERVVVLSIPDWSVTPFAAQGLRDVTQIKTEIETYNAAIRQIIAGREVHYLNITASTREGAKEPMRIADDGLHPSDSEYSIWAEMLASLITSALSVPG